MLTSSSGVVGSEALQLGSGRVDAGVSLGDGDPIVSLPRARPRKSRFCCKTTTIRDGANTDEISSFPIDTKTEAPRLPGVKS